MLQAHAHKRALVGLPSTTDHPSMTTKKKILDGILFAAHFTLVALACIYVAIAVIGATHDGIDKASDEHAHCYVHRNYISCVPRTDDASTSTPTPTKKARTHGMV